MLKMLHECLFPSGKNLNRTSHVITLTVSSQTLSQDVLRLVPAFLKTTDPPAVHFLYAKLTLTR